MPRAHAIPTGEAGAVVGIKTIAANLVKTGPALAVAQFKMGAVLVDGGIAAGAVEGIAIVHRRLGVPRVGEISAIAQAQRGNVEGRAGVERVGGPKRR